MKDGLGELTDKLYQVEAEINQWFEDHVRDRLRNCKSKDEVKAIVRELSIQCRSGSGEIRDMPSSIHVVLCIKMSEFV